MTYEAMAADTAAFMEALGIGPAHLVVWSDGGSVALYVALRRPRASPAITSFSFH